MIEIIIASHNLHKIREFKEMFHTLKGVEILSLLQFPEIKLPEETETTFLGNATLKAKHVAKKLKKWVLADDSGLVVPALKGEPGVFSARYAGENATDKENRAKLLAQMKPFSDLERAAYFECCLVLATPKGDIKKSVTGLCEGLILEEEMGSNGFGYDSLFKKHDYKKTFAQISETIKNKISHRWKAVEKLFPTIEGLVKEESYKS